MPEDEVMQSLADLLDESGKYDSVAYDGDGLIILYKDGKCGALHYSALTGDPE